MLLVPTVVHIYTRSCVCEATSAEPCGFVVPTRALLGNHAGQASLKAHWNLMHCVQMSVMQHPSELQFTCRHGKGKLM